MGLYIGKMDRKWLSRVLIIMLADILGILGSYLLALWGPVRPPLHGYSAGVSAGISEHHLVVGTDLPGGVLVMQPL